jgi:site-specific DNA-methyltransferase (adenine-specific)
MRFHPDGDALFYGDNLEILRNHIEDEKVDLIYLDPPFNSNANYNVLFKSPDGKQSASQIEAFEDTWHWTDAAESAFDDVMKSGHSDAAEMLRAMRSVLKENDMMAYLAMMAVRLIELHRVLKPTGSIYLHCDPTASHYLKILMDAVFGVSNYRNEITWKRRQGFSSAVHDSIRFGNCTDTILFFSKSKTSTFTPQYNKDTQDYKDYVRKFFTLKDKDGRLYQATSLTNPAYRPNLIYEYKGYAPPTNGWMISRDKMEEWDRQGRIHFPADKAGRLRRKSYADELKGMPIQNLWDDIPQLGSHDAERLGYPTQKPVALLERIISASSNEGDTVLDPFCGCGTTIHAAEKLNRRWIGIDITHLAIGLIRDRLRDAFPQADFEIIGVPKDVGAARELAAADKHEFQLWAFSMVGAQQYKGGRKGADGGVDGYIWFQPDGRNHEKAVVSVKGGEHVDVKMIRDLIATVDREKARVGVFITLTPPTRPMKTESAAAGFYESPMHGRFEKIQILTIEDLFNQQRPHLPWISPSSKRAKREKGDERQMGMDV